MPQTKTKYSEFDLAPQRERHDQRPIPGAPLNPPSDEADATQEIRSLIDDLQESGRASRERLQEAEHARDTLAGQLAVAARQLQELQAREKRSQQQLAEASNLQRERDGAREALERLARQTKDFERKLEAAIRERDAAAVQRDDATRRREEATHSGREAAAQLAQVQKQVISIRQARDAAQAQGREHAIKLSRLDDEIAELGSARDSAQKAARQAAEEAADFRRQLDAVTLDCDATAKQVSQLQRELDEQRAKVLNLTEQKSAVAMADSEHVTALAEAREQVLSLTHERDAAHARAEEQARALDEIRQHVQEMRDRQASESVPAAELEEARRQLVALVAERDRHVAREKEFLEETGSQQERLAALTEQLAAAQQQIDQVICDRDAAQQKGVESTLGIEAQLSALRKQVGELEKCAGEAGKRVEAAHRERDDALTKAAHFESQRLQSIDLAAQLDAAKRDLLNLSADLAESRLQMKFAQAGKASVKSAPKLPPLPTTPGIGDFHLNPMASLRREGDADDEPSAFIEQAPINEPLTERHAKSALAAMRKCFQSFTKNPADLSLLNELHCHAHGFAERASISGYVALHRLGSSLANLMQELYNLPEEVNPSTLRTVSQTIDFLGMLTKQKGYEKLPDPAKARVYAVDDEVDNSDAIKMAMETVMLRTQTAQEPSVALAELESGRFDLIFLDVNMPDMDGFELCQHIRAIASCAHTPIVFLTGLATAENRVQASLCGGNDFVGKPFNLHELGLKALTLILKSSLGLE